eukprot:3809319-Rhodomonas_salina.3
MTTKAPCPGSSMAHVRTGRVARPIADATCGGRALVPAKPASVPGVSEFAVYTVLRSRRSTLRGGGTSEELHTEQSENVHEHYPDNCKRPGSSIAPVSTGQGVAGA